MTTALVTGATGFVGHHLVRAILEKGWPCRALVRDEKRARRLLPDGVEPVCGDISDPRSLVGIGRGVDCVFHAAAQLNLPGISADDYTRVNLRGTQNLVEALRGSSLFRFVHISSIAAVGLRNYGMIDETFPCDPDLPYGISKLRIDEYLQNAFKDSGFPSVIVRPPTVYGEGERYNFLSLCRAIQSGRFLIIGDGRNRTDFCWIGNLVQAMMKAAQKGREGELYLVADEPVLTFRESADVLSRIVRARPLTRLSLPKPMAYAVSVPIAAVGRLLGHPVPLYPTRVRTMTADLCFNLSKAKRELGLEPVVSFAECAAETIRWYREEGLLPKTS